MAEQLLVINPRTTESLEALDASITSSDSIEWAVGTALPDSFDPSKSTLVLVVAGAPSDDAAGRPERMRGPVESWMLWRLVIARAASIQPALESNCLVLEEVVEEDRYSLRGDVMSAVSGLIGGYEDVEGLDESSLRTALETAAGHGASMFPERASDAARKPAGQPSAPTSWTMNTSPERYLVNRRDFVELRDVPAPALAHQVFFQMWQNRQAPFEQIAEGDVVYLGDTDTRRVYWEVRVGSLLRDGYESTAEALDALWHAYGIAEDDLNDYHRTRPSAGVVLAWAPIVMRPLDVTLPAGQHFGQNGYRKLEQSDLDAIGMPDIATGDPIAEPPDTYDPRDWRLRPLAQISRYIPLHVRLAVWDRDGGTCVGGCGATTGLHFDHIVPFSRGGKSTVENIRLLCARSNLSKGSKGPDAPLACVKP